MTLMQSTPPGLATPDDVKNQITAHEATSKRLLTRVGLLLARREALADRLESLADQYADLRRARGWALLRLVTGEAHADAIKAKGLQHTARTIHLDAKAIHGVLKRQEYVAIESAMHDHYEDLKALTLLEIRGDAESDAYLGRVTASISALRRTQRNIEEHGQDRPDIPEVFGSEGQPDAHW